MSLNCPGGQGFGGESVDFGWIGRLNSRVNNQWIACISAYVVSNFWYTTINILPTSAPGP